jgi:hypothetical protein
MGPPAIFLGAALGVMSISEQRKANKEARAANRAQQRAAAIQNARARRQALAQSVQARATATAQGVNSGVGSSSALSGIQSSITSQVASNISFQNQLEQLDVLRFNKLNSSMRHSMNADTYGGLSQLSMTIGQATMSPGKGAT